VREGERAAKAAAREADRAAKGAAKEERALAALEEERDLAHRAAAARAAEEERLAALRADAASLGEPFDGAAPDLDRLARDAARARELAERLARLEADRERAADAERDLAKAADRIAEVDRALAALTEEAEGLSFDPEAHTAARDERDDAEREVGERRGTDREAADGRADAERLLAGLTGRLAEARETERRVGDLRIEARELDRTAILLDGFRDHLVARVGPELSREAEALFRELTNHEYDDLRIDEESLAIQIADGDAYFPVQRFSGSEADLANLALRVAISSHLSRVAGADLGIMVLDEVLASLDAERKDLLVRALGSLASHFHQLFVITHAEQVKDRFPAAIEVRKVGRRRGTATLV